MKVFIQNMIGGIVASLLARNLGASFAESFLAFIGGAILFVLNYYVSTEHEK